MDKYALRSYIKERLTVIDKQIAALDNEADLLNDIMVLVSQEDADRKNVWFVPSMTGGPGHYITNTGDIWGDYVCNCEAGRNGRRCWAVEGVEAEIQTTSRPQRVSFRFIDRKYKVEHFATRITE